jgi:hypothetical protein
MTERNKRGPIAALNIQITAGTMQKLKTAAVVKSRFMWEIVEEALTANLKRKGSPAATDKNAPIVKLNVEIGADLKKATNILAATNDKRLRYEVEDALLIYLKKI